MTAGADPAGLLTPPGSPSPPCRFLLGIHRKAGLHPSSTGALEQKLRLRASRLKFVRGGQTMKPTLDPLFATRISSELPEQSASSKTGNPAKVKGGRDAKAERATANAI